MVSRGLEVKTTVKQIYADKAAQTHRQILVGSDRANACNQNVGLDLKEQKGSR